MIVVHPIPGQETKNTQFLVAIGAAEQVDDMALVGVKAEELLKDVEKLKKMRQAALTQGHSDSALDVAKLILKQPSITDF